VNFKRFGGHLKRRITSKLHVREETENSLESLHHSKPKQKKQKSPIGKAGIVVKELKASIQA
jgi:hypothetical protein